MVFISSSLIFTKVPERVDYLTKNRFISLKDHKQNFSSNPKYRLSNPAKSEIGKISKYFLQHLNSKVTALSPVNHWQETSTVINWFKNIKNKKKYTFMQFDIVEFFLLISEELQSSNICENFSKYQ